MLKSRTCGVLTTAFAKMGTKTCRSQKSRAKTLTNVPKTHTRVIATAQYVRTLRGHMSAGAGTPNLSRATKRSANKKGARSLTGAANARRGAPLAITPRAQTSSQYARAMPTTLATATAKQMMAPPGAKM